MRTLFSLVFVSGVVLASGCATDPVDPGSQSSSEEDYGFLKDTSGRAVHTDLSSLRKFTPENGFDRGPAQSATAEDAAAGSCSGVCNANVCVCSGDLDCCIVGCVVCWEVLQN